MGLKTIITSYSICFNCSAGINSRWHPEISEKQPYYLPYGKADGTASPALCLGSAAPSTFATLGSNKYLYFQ